MAQALRIAPDDDVATLLEDGAAGDIARWNGGSIPLADAVPVGHKVALRRIAGGARLMKYGAAIGVATREISPASMSIRTISQPGWIPRSATLVLRYRHRRRLPATNREGFAATSALMAGSARATRSGCCRRSGA